MDVNELLEKHENLGIQLEKIPSNRIITYREALEEGKLIGKPRFKPRFYQWEPAVLASIRDHLQNIWNFFDKNSFWFDNNLKELLFFDTRHLSKKSIIFLLERDVWETDEVYGAYLIEPQKERTDISYYRFDHKFETFTLDNIDEKFRKEWICKNAIQQIKQQFGLIWKRIEIEILTCQEETYHRPIFIQISDEDLIKQLEICQKLLNISKEAALLLLGRVEEIWLLKAIDRTRVYSEEKLLSLAEDKGIINKKNKRLFLQIRTQFNLLKHTTTYNIDNCDVENLIKHLGCYLNRTKK